MSYSIDFPPRFVSRTCNPHDSCYLGRQTARQKQAKARQETTVRIGGRTWRLWTLMQTRRRMMARDIAAELGCTVKAVSGTAKRLVKCGALRVDGDGGRFYYVLGSTAVVEI